MATVRESPSPAASVLAGRLLQRGDSLAQGRDVADTSPTAGVASMADREAERKRQAALAAAKAEREKWDAYVASLEAPGGPAPHQAQKLVDPGPEPHVFVGMQDPTTRIVPGIAGMFGSPAAHNQDAFIGASEKQFGDLVRDGLIPAPPTGPSLDNLSLLPQGAGSKPWIMQHVIPALEERYAGDPAVLERLASVRKALTPGPDPLSSAVDSGLRSITGGRVGLGREPADHPVLMGANGERPPPPYSFRLKPGEMVKTWRPETPPTVNPGEGAWYQEDGIPTRPADADAVRGQVGGGRLTSTMPTQPGEAPYRGIKVTDPPAPTPPRSPPAAARPVPDPGALPNPLPARGAPMRDFVSRRLGEAPTAPPAPPRSPRIGLESRGSEPVEGPGGRGAGAAMIAAEVAGNVASGQFHVDEELLHELTLIARGAYDKKPVGSSSIEKARELTAKP